MPQPIKEAASICKTIMRNGYDAYVINAALQEQDHRFVPGRGGGNLHGHGPGRSQEPFSRSRGRRRQCRGLHDPGQLEFPFSSR